MAKKEPGTGNPVLADVVSQLGQALPDAKTLPQGTVTFLLTDIEDSTLHWERDPHGMESHLARHDAIVRANIERHGGTIFKTTGDGAYAAFAVAADALSAALDTQREITSQVWIGQRSTKSPHGTLDGVAEQRNDDYFGVVLNRASRLLALAGGQQVLLGASTAELVMGPYSSRSRVAEARAAPAARREAADRDLSRRGTLPAG